MHILFPYHSNSSNYLILREIINQSKSILGKNIYIYIPHTCERAQRQFRTTPRLGRYIEVRDIPQTFPGRGSTDSSIPALWYPTNVTPG